MTDTPDLREQIASLFRSAPGEERLGDQTPGEIADAVLELLPKGFDRFVKTVELLRDRLGDTTRERDEARTKLRLVNDDVSNLVEMVKVCTGHPDSGLPSHFDMIQRVEASRRDWAAEAARLDVVIDSVAAEYDELAEKADLQIGEHADALMAWGCWRNAARKLRKAAVHPDSNGGAT